MLSLEKIEKYWDKNKLCTCGHHWTVDHTYSGRCTACLNTTHKLATNLDYLELIASVKGLI